jgi:hypothetical protein
MRNLKIERVFAPKEGVTKLLALPRGEMAIEIVERVFAPKGLQRVRPGFQPRELAQTALRPEGAPDRLA